MLNKFAYNVLTADHQIFWDNVGRAGMLKNKMYLKLSSRCEEDLIAAKILPRSLLLYQNQKGDSLVSSFRLLIFLDHGD